MLHPQHGRAKLTVIRPQRENGVKSQISPSTLITIRFRWGFAANASAALCATYPFFRHQRIKAPVAKQGTRVAFVQHSIAVCTARGKQQSGDRSNTLG
jgi:hypothetical protein